MGGGEEPVDWRLVDSFVNCCDEKKGGALVDVPGIVFVGGSGLDEL